MSNDAGEWIVIARKRKRLTQRQLADLLNITPNRLCGWERGRYTTPRQYAEQIARVLETQAPKTIKKAHSGKASARIPGGEWLKKQRNRRGISLSAIAEIIGVEKETMRRWEDAGSLIPVEKFHKIVDYFCRYKILPSIEAQERAEKHKIEMQRIETFVNKLREIDRDELYG